MATRIGIISDTHLRSPEPFLEQVVETHFRDVELILHAGDIVTPEVLQVFHGREVIAVAGNCDTREVKKTLPEKELVTVKGFRIGLVHGWGPPFGLEKRVAASFRDVHCLVFGHSHRAANRIRSGVLYFNPGSFRSGIFSWWRRSIGVLTVDRDIRGEIIPL